VNKRLRSNDLDLIGRHEDAGAEVVQHQLFSAQFSGGIQRDRDGGVADLERAKGKLPVLQIRYVDVQGDLADPHQQNLMRSIFVEKDVLGDETPQWIQRQPPDRGMNAALLKLLCDDVTPAVGEAFALRVVGYPGSPDYDQDKKDEGDLRRTTHEESDERSAPRLRTKSPIMRPPEWKCNVLRPPRSLPGLERKPRDKPMGVTSAHRPAQEKDQPTLGG
jgi:hypothetical protein